MSSLRVSFPLYCFDLGCRIANNHLLGFPKCRILGRSHNAQDRGKESSLAILAGHRVAKRSDVTSEWEGPYD